MLEYIEREALMKLMQANFRQGSRDGCDHPMYPVVGRPAVDVVEVVRCRDCKYWSKGDFECGDDLLHMEYGGRCPNASFVRFESDFCSYGERRNNT